MGYASEYADYFNNTLFAWFTCTFLDAFGLKENIHQLYFGQELATVLESIALPYGEAIDNLIIGNLVGSI